MINILAFGGGEDSTSLALIDLDREKACKILGRTRLELDEVFPPVTIALFSDPGNEWPQTYENVTRMTEAYLAVGKELVTVRRQGENIVQWLMRLGTVPLMPGGSHICSLKFKGEVMQKYARERFGRVPMQWAIGIEAGEEKRSKRFTVKDAEGEGQHTFYYPLMSLGLFRADCTEFNIEMGWGSVHKSSCVCCPFMEACEISDLVNNNPDGWETVKAIEARFRETSPVRHAAWVAAGRPLNKAGRAPRGMWRIDSWAAGARLYARRAGGKQLSTVEWEEKVRLEALTAAK